MEARPRSVLLVKRLEVVPRDRNNVRGNLRTLQLLGTLQVPNGDNNAGGRRGVVWPKDLRVEHVEARVRHVLERHPLIIEVHFHWCVTALNGLDRLLVSKDLSTSDVSLEFVGRP